jgi:hypothetical protein
MTQGKIWFIIEGLAICNALDEMIRAQELVGETTRQGIKRVYDD